MSDEKTTHRFHEARELARLADRLEAVLRRAPKALLQGVTPEAFVAQIASVRAMTEGLASEIEALENLFAL